MTDPVNSTPYDSDQLRYIADLQASLEEQLTELGYDPAVFFENLDGELTLDLKNNPAYQTYLMLAFQQLAYVQFGGEDLMSIYGDTDIDWSSFESMQASMDEDLFNFLDNLVQDNPEFMAMAVTLDQGSTAGNQVLAALNGELSSLSTTTEEEFDFNMDDAYALMDELGVTGLEDFAEFEESARSISANLMLEIANVQEYIAEGANLYSGDELSAFYEVQSDNLQILMVELQNVQSLLQTMASMMTEIMKTQGETQRQIAAAIA